MASHAVFGTVELLENILIFVPASELKAAERVSKFWNEVVRTSPTIRKMRCLRPTSDSVGNIPLYDSKEVSLLLLPVLCRIGRAITYGSTEVTLTRLMFTQDTAGQLLRYKDRFLTRSRVTAVYAAIGAHHTSDRNECVIYVRDGVKIKDVFAVWESMERTNRQALEDEKGLLGWLGTTRGPTSIALQLARFRDKAH